MFSSFHSILCWLCSYSLISATSHKPHQVYFTAYGCNVLHLSPHPFHFLPFHFFLHFFPLLSLFFTNHCSPSFTCIRVNYWKLSDVLHSLYIFDLISLNFNLHYPYYYHYSYSKYSHNILLYPIWYMIDAYRQSCTPCYAIPSLHKTFSHCSRSCPSQRNLCTVPGHTCYIDPTSCFQRNIHL